MALITRPIVIEDGVWVTSRCMVSGGVTIGRSALITPMSVVNRDVPANSISGGNPAGHQGWRFVME
ncbi:hypothetical protein PIJ49_12475 [Curtobacterium sp. 20TX0008]|nr:hypothetical protein [Curtobacterium sp. 20TX0008]MDB6427910.1 hypothetical protein [Curtobacterium sp. 20TX0008]